MLVNSYGEVPIYFISTKIDCLGSVTDQKEVSEAIVSERNLAIKKCESQGRLYFECSALSKDGIKIAMDSILITVYQNLFRL
jgi:hypothetical protein